MYIRVIKIQHFRNIVHGEMEFHPKLNWITGENGSGKTSLLEAIHCLGSGRSFRASNANQLIQHQSEQFNLFGVIEESVEKDTRIGMQVSKNKKQIRVNGEDISVASSLAEILPVQVIAPDIYKLVDEGPRYRRKFIDWGVFHVEHQFKNDWTKLTKLLKQRNAELRTASRYQDVSHWDQEYIPLSNHINNSRRHYIEQLAFYLSKYFNDTVEFCEVGLALAYGWPVDKNLQDCLLEHFYLDKKKSLTHYGPHKADLRIKLGSNMFRDVASRGQIKLLASMLKLAQIDYLENVGQRNAVLLMDDITSEFDTSNQRKILNWGLESRSQLFITCTDRASVDRLNSGLDCKMFHVEHGEFREVI